ncbi:MAG TPA: hypothetical protein P5050_06085 [Bacteroidia bacterium]|nr:hypothetical protein [Bacteroidia bacterium]HRS58774.1 hypothetical protein [Bacteroidia bacterium]
MSYWKKILIFSLIPITFLLVLEMTARQIYPAHSDLPLKYACFEKKADETVCLITGHSHAEKGIDPSQLNIPSFNLAYSAQDLYYTRQTIKKYLPKLEKVKLIVLAIDPFIFRYDEQNSSPYFVKDYFFSLGIWPRRGFDFQFWLNASVFWLNRGRFFNDLIDRDIEKKEIRVYKREQAPTSGGEGQYLMDDGQRLAIGIMNASELKRDAEATLKRILQHSDRKIISKNFSFLQQLIQSASGKNIQVIMIYMPVCQYYNELIPEEVRKESDMLIKKLLASEKNVEFYDFSDYFKGRNEYFFNADHLNNQGAKVFSRMLGTTVLKNR